MKSQRQIVIDKLIRNGKVDNFWAFHNYILRLWTIIHTLRKDGIEIITHYKNIKGHKNCVYEVSENSIRDLTRLI